MPQDSSYQGPFLMAQFLQTWRPGVSSTVASRRAALFGQRLAHLGVVPNTPIPLPQTPFGAGRGPTPYGSWLLPDGAITIGSPNAGASGQASSSDPGGFGGAPNINDSGSGSGDSGDSGSGDSGDSGSGDSGSGDSGSGDSGDSGSGDSGPICGGCTDYSLAGCATLPCPDGCPVAYIITDDLGTIEAIYNICGCGTVQDCTGKNNTATFICCYGRLPEWSGYPETILQNNIVKCIGGTAQCP